MKTPVCESCIATNSLCAGCQEKLDKGVIAPSDLQLARALYKHKEELPSEERGFLKTIEFSRILLVFTDSPAALIGKGGKIVAALSKELGKKIKVVDVNASNKDKVSEILLPARLLGINELFKKEGKEYRVRLPREDANKLPMDLVSLNKVIETVLGAKTALAFE